MGVAGAALLYSCSPGIGAGLGAMPYLWLLSNPFFRGAPQATAPPVNTPGSAAVPGSRSGGLASPDAPPSAAAQATPSQSQRGGFGSTASAGDSSGTS